MRLPVRPFACLALALAGCALDAVRDDPPPRDAAPPARSGGWLGGQPAALARDPEAAVAGPWFGGAGGTPRPVGGGWLDGLHGRAGAFVDALGVRAGAWSTAAHGGSGGDPFSLGCAPGEEAAGVYGGAGLYVDRIGLLCRPAGAWAAPAREGGTAGGAGGVPFRWVCPRGAALRQLYVRAGTYVDAIQPICGASGGG